MCSGRLDPPTKPIAVSTLWFLLQAYNQIYGVPFIPSPPNLIKSSCTSKIIRHLRHLDILHPCSRFYSFGRRPSIFCEPILMFANVATSFYTSYSLRFVFSSFHDCPFCILPARLQTQYSCWVYVTKFSSVSQVKPAERGQRTIKI